MPKHLLSETTITSALRSLRVRTIREGLPGLEHIEALLALRGHNLPPVPPAHRYWFRRGGLRRAVVQALQQGPMGLDEIVAAVYAGKATLAERPASNRAVNVLTRLKRDGVAWWRIRGGCGG
jgi:hypothetical protein